MITISITSVVKGRPRTNVMRDQKAGAVLLISDGQKTKTVTLWLHDVPDKSAIYSDDEAVIRGMAQALINNPEWRKRIEGWL